MSEHLMSPDDLKEVTGKKRYSKQAEWFKRAYGVDVTRRDDGSIVMTWATYEALNAKKAGVGVVASTPRRAEVCSPFS